MNTGDITPGSIYAHIDQSLGAWEQRPLFSAVWIYGTGKAYTAPLGAYEINLPDGSMHDYVTIGDKTRSDCPIITD